MTLTGPAPTGGLTVALSSNSATATVPDTVTVPAGETTAPFAVETTPTAETTVATITAVHGTVTKTADLTVEAQQPPPAEALALQSLSLSPTSVVGGRSATGTVTLSGAAPAGGIVVALSCPSTVLSGPSSVTVPEGQSSKTFTISTTAVTTSTTATITAACNGVTKTAALRVTPRFEITNIQNGDVLSGVVSVDVTVYDTTLSTDELNFKVDTILVSVPMPRGNNVRTSHIRTELKSNGPHLIEVVDNTGHSESRNVTFQNDVSNLRYDSIFDVSSHDDSIPSIARAVATGTVSTSWSVTIESDAADVVRTFPVTTGATLDVTWDGRNDVGVMQPDGNYLLIISTGSPATSQESRNTATRRRQGTRSRRLRRGIRTRGYNLAAAGEGGGAASPTTVILNKNKITDSMILIDEQFFAHEGYDPLKPDRAKQARLALDYSKYIRTMVDVKYGSTFDDKANPIVLGLGKTGCDSEATGPCPPNSPAKEIARINKQFSLRPLKLVYVASHGNDDDDIPKFSIGPYWWYSKGNSRTEDTPTTRFDVSAMVYHWNYGGLGDPDAVPFDPPKLVWMDHCHSAGGSKSKNPAGEPNFIMGDNDSWSNCFGIDSFNGYEGVFLGISGYGFMDNADINDPMHNWHTFRRELWNRLFFEGRNFGTALDLSLSSTPRTAGGTRNPDSRLRWKGTGSTFFN